MTDLRVTQYRTDASVSYDGGDLQVLKLYSLAAVSRPAEELQASQTLVEAVVRTTMSLRVAQCFILAAVRGRVADPVVRTWTYTLDNHDYYVVKLGDLETLVYDTLTQQWYNWGSGTSPLWRALTGTNWLGAVNFSHVYGSNIVVGDDTTGTLYFLDPTTSVDDDAVLGADLPRPFERVVQGQVLAKGYHANPCYGLSLEGSVGETGDLEDYTVTLEISDDRGHTYTDVGSIDVPSSDYSTRIHWRSLGSFKMPGRLFKITDYGALKRIDALEMDTRE